MRENGYLHILGKLFPQERQRQYDEVVRKGSRNISKFQKPDENIQN